MPPLRTAEGTRRGPKAIADVLREALSHLESLADTRPDDDPGKLERYNSVYGKPSGRIQFGVSHSDDLPIHACGVDREHREVVQPFLESWVIPSVRDALDALDGKEIEYGSMVLEAHGY
jgi:hypothetical protein